MNIEVQGQNVMIDGKAASPADVEGLIRLLSLTRAGMQPVVPLELAHGTDLPVLANPHFYTDIPADHPGHTLFAFRDPGQGWRGVLMPLHEVSKLMGYWANQISVFTEPKVDASKLS